MVRGRHHHQVLDPVVGWVFVDVVDMLLLGQLPAKVLLHHFSMNQDRSPSSVFMYVGPEHVSMLSPIGSVAFHSDKITYLRATFKIGGTSGNRTHISHLPDEYTPVVLWPHGGH